MKRRDRDEDSGERKRFKYRPPSREEINRRSKQQSGKFDSPFVDGIKMYSPKEGDHRIRILPATWKGAEHYGVDVFIHYGVGADNNRYLCPSKMKDEPCPVCKEQARAQRQKDEEYAKGLRANCRVAVWVIDRNKEEEGPQLWAMPLTVSKEINKRSEDKRSKEIYHVDDPGKNGYDVEFTVEGSKDRTKYTGISLARKSCYLSDDEAQSDEWLEYVQDHPIPDLLQFFDEEHIQKQFEGAGKKDDDEDDERPTRHSRRDRDEEEDDDERPRKRRRDEDDDLDEPDDDEDDRPRKKRSRGDDDEEDDRPRKKRRDDDEDDRPRKKRRDEEEDDEDEDRPKRNRLRDDDEDEDDRPRKKRSRGDDDEDDD